jgi:D-arabinose 5-phosphate isomerase GutQ
LHGFQANSKLASNGLVVIEVLILVRTASITALIVTSIMALIAALIAPLVTLLTARPLPY